MLSRKIKKLTNAHDMTKYIKTCTELSHPGCLLLQFYALNHVFNRMYARIIPPGTSLKIKKQNCLSSSNLSFLAKRWFHKIGILRLQKEDGVHLFLILRCNLYIDCLTLVCFTDLHVHLLKSEFLQV